LNLKRSHRKETKRPPQAAITQTKISLFPTPEISEPLDEETI
jgi:hypothetical protein